MKRKLLEELIEWKEKNDAKRPLFLSGPRAVGKTYLAFEFAHSFFRDTVYINLERHSKLKQFFKSDSHDKTVEEIESFYKVRLRDLGTIVILDEISCCPNAQKFVIEELKREDCATLVIVSSNPISYMETFAPCQDLFEHKSLYPFDFEEYLWATGYEWYADLIREHYLTNRKLPDIVHKELIEMVEQFLVIGGMPKSINEYMETDTFINISEQHHMLLRNYSEDAALHVHDTMSTKVSNVLSTMDQQIGKKNRKFQYRFIRKGATKAMYQEAFEYLSASHAIIQVEKLDSDIFKAFLCDVGMQLSLANEHFDEMHTINEYEFRKGLVETYIAQNLIATHSHLFYWESEASARIDFVLVQASGKGYLPIEVSIDQNTRSKSLSIFKETHPVTETIKLSTNHFACKNGIKYVPLYAVFCI